MTRPPFKMRLVTPPQRGLRGFTIIELLVSSAVIVIMMVLIGQLFTSTTNAVSLGASRGDILAVSEALVTQFNLDAEAMVGPHADADDNAFATPESSGGILIIVQKRIGDTNNNGILNDDTNNNGVINPSEGETGTEGVLFPLPGQGEARRFVRSDQLVFITQRREGDNPLCPMDSSTYEPTNDGFPTAVDAAKYMRVWYGHAMRAEANGNPGTGYLGSGADERCTNWILARHALFLGEQAPTPGWAHAQSAANDAAMHATDAYAGIPTLNNCIRNGFTDYARFSFDNYTAGPSLVGADDALTNDPNFLRLHAQLLNSPLNATAPYSDYRQRALAWYTFPSERLRVNLTPQTNGAAPVSWQIAQMHAALAEHCSDFIVEWAGDIDDNDDPATYGAPDGEIDVLADGSIRWYGHYFNNSMQGNNQSGGGHDVLLPTVYQPAGALIPYLDNVEIGTWTAALRTEIDGAFAWRHDDEAGLVTTSATPQPSYWPYLIRIRYRLHDPKGKLMSGSAGPDHLLASHGVWFEHIIRVNRPTP